MIKNTDCIEGMKAMEENSVDSIVTDSPYELGFMNKKWDASGISYNVEVWEQALRVLKPGGFLLAFGGTRTCHRLTCAIEDAGFEIRDMIGWIYGSGFPKSLNIGKAIDKLQGNEREITGRGEAGYNVSISKIRVQQGYRPNLTKSTREFDLTKGNSEWEGWGTALKPALEPITVARKPLSEKTVAQNVLKWGTGGINVDGCRIETDEIKQNNSFSKTKSTFVQSDIGHPRITGSGTNHQQGRFPANLIHDGSDEVEALFPQTKSGGHNGKHKTIGKTGMFNNEYQPKIINSNSGSASRFFYCAKSSKRDRDEGLEEVWNLFEQRDGFKTTGTSRANMKMSRAFCKNCNVVFENCKCNNSLREYKYTEKDAIRNSHPTVKPTDLMRYLVRLVTPKGGIVLDPFMGSGSTGKACVLEGMNFIGFEKEKEYYEIAKARIEKFNYQMELVI